MGEGRGRRGVREGMGVMAMSTPQEVLSAFRDEVDRAIADRQKPKGGQQVPFHGDFAGASPTVLNRLKWWIRELERTLEGEESK